MLRCARVQRLLVSVVLIMVYYCSSRRLRDSHHGCKLSWSYRPITIASLVGALARKVNRLPAIVRGEVHFLDTCLLAFLSTISAVDCIVSPSTTGGAVAGILYLLALKQATNMSHGARFLAQLAAQRVGRFRAWREFQRRPLEAEVTPKLTALEPKTFCDKYASEYGGRGKV